jgi:hypothetical protein
MNALDFLVDFVALVSTSEASRPDYDGDNVDHEVEFPRSKAESASEMRVSPSERFHSVNGKQPVDALLLQSNTAPSSSYRELSAYMTDLSSSKTHYYGPCEEPFTVPADPNMMQPFSQFLYQHPGLGLPCVTPGEMSYHDCDFERLAQCGPRYGMNYLRPAEPLSWAHVQPQPHPPNHDIRFLETQYVLLAEKTSMQSSQCMNATCHCQYPPPHHQAGSNDYFPGFSTHIWGPNRPVYDKIISEEDDEWLWASARRQPEMSRI